MARLQFVFAVGLGSTHELYSLFPEFSKFTRRFSVILKAMVISASEGVPLLHILPSFSHINKTVRVDT